MSSENFCLKWNDHHSVFFSNAEKLCHGSLLTDVVISAGGTLFQAHKLVLSVCSKFFQDVFSQPILPQSQSTVIYLKDVESKHMQLLLSYMYRGEVDVEDNELAEFLKTASGLQIKGLSEQENNSKPQKEITPEKPKHTKSFMNHVDSSVPKRKPERPVTPPATKASNHSYHPTEEITIEDNPPAKRIKEESVLIDHDEPTSTWTNQPKPTAHPTIPKVPEIPRQAPTNYMVSQTNQPEAEYMDDYADYSGEMMYEEEDQTIQNYNQTDQGMSYYNEAQYPCPQCQKTFPSKAKLNRHILIHTNEKPYSCSVCSKRFNIRSNGIRHVVSVHNIPDGSSYILHDQPAAQMF